MERLKEDMLWFIPLTAITFFIYEVLIKTTSVKDAKFFGDTAAVFLGPLLVSAIIVVVNRAVDAGSPFTNPAVRILVYPVSVLIFLAGWGAVPPHWRFLPDQVDEPPAKGAPVSPESSPGNSLRGTLRIGINGCLPGWSDAVEYRKKNGCADIAGREFREGEVIGMDADLARFLSEKNGFDIVFVAITQADRERLWCGTNGNPRDIDMLISVYSITPERRKCARFTSPYYLDVNEVWHLEKGERIVTAYGCAVSGTTGLDRLEEIERAGKPFGGEGRLIAESSGNLAACLEKFNGADAAVRYVSSDWSILQAYYRGVYGRGQQVTYVENNGRVTDDNVRPVPGAAGERYAIALPRGEVTACAALSADVAAYLDADAGQYENTWIADFGEHIQPALTEAGGGAATAEPSWHRPTSSGAGPAACS